MIHSADILVVGGGFAGFSCFQYFKPGKRGLCLLTNRNHFLFTPLLPLAAAGTVGLHSIIEPVYSFEKKHGETLIGEAVDLLPQEKKIIAKFNGHQTGEIHYNALIISVGALVSTFGITGVREHCFFVKEMKDARDLREKIIYQFEKSRAVTAEERKKALNFVVIGAGATGVEVACEIHDLVYQDLKKNFQEVIPETQIQIIEATNEILPNFDRTLARYAQGKLKQKGIGLRMETPVESVERGRVLLADGETLEADIIIWATGNGPQAFTRKAAERLHIEMERGGRLPVDPFLRILAPYENIYAIGDCASLKTEKGVPLPATAQIAMKQGIHLGRNLSQGLQRPFRSKSLGMLASLGSGSAIADLGFLRFKGILAWWFWKTAYITRLVSWRNKVSVFFDWIGVRFFGRNTARIEF